MCVSSSADHCGFLPDLQTNQQQLCNKAAILFRDKLRSVVSLNHEAATPCFPPADISCPGGAEQLWSFQKEVRLPALGAKSTQNPAGSTGLTKINFGLFTLISINYIQTKTSLFRD
ncbi:MAG: hypothetical protein U0Y08_09025 [Bacteroidia bacterium]